MKHRSHLALVFLIVAVLSIQTALAQFPLKMPKLPKAEKPKTEQPKSEGNSSPQNQPNQDSSNQNQNRTAQKTGGGHERIKRIEPTATPMFMKDTLEVKIQSDNHYWKAPHQNDYTSWVPQISFKVFFDGNTKLRYSAEWINPDGSAWFSESLDAGPFSDDDQTVGISSPSVGLLRILVMTL